MKNTSDNPKNKDLKTMDENPKNKDLANRIAEFEKNWVYREPAPRYNRD